MSSLLPPGPLESDIVPIWFWPGLTFLVGSGVAIAVVLVTRKRSSAWLNTRTRRLVFDILAIVILQGALAVCFAGVDLSAIVSGTERNTLFLWLSAGIGVLHVAAQTFTASQAETLDEQRKQAREEHEKVSAQLDDARSYRDFVMVVNEACVRVVSLKRERLKSADRNSDLFATLAPGAQAAALITAAWEIFNGLIKTPGEKKWRVRVVYFHVRDGSLHPIHSYNGISSDCVCPLDGMQDRVRAMFRLKARDGCLATEAARNGAKYLIPDTEKAHEDPDNPFVFFEARERAELKSIAALPIRLDGDRAPWDVLVVDTDRPGFFDPADAVLEEQLKIIVENLAHRLLLELQMAAKLSENGDESDETTSSA